MELNEHTIKVLVYSGDGFAGYKGPPDTYWLSFDIYAIYLTDFKVKTSPEYPEGSLWFEGPKYRNNGSWTNPHVPIEHNNNSTLWRLMKNLAIEAVQAKRAELGFPLLTNRGSRASSSTSPKSQDTILTADDMKNFDWEKEFDRISPVDN